MSSLPKGWQIIPCASCSMPTGAVRAERPNVSERTVMLASAGYVTQLGTPSPTRMIVCKRGRGRGAGCHLVMLDDGPLVCCDDCERDLLKAAGLAPTASQPAETANAARLESDVAAALGATEETRIAILACRARGRSVATLIPKRNPWR